MLYRVVFRTYLYNDFAGGEFIDSFCNPLLFFFFFHNGKFIEVTEESLKGKWSVLVFLPAAFTFNCPTEIEDAANNYAEFQKAGAEVYIVTTDTHFSHKVWHETSDAVGKAKFPLIGDPTHKLTRAFDVHIEEESLALRGTFIINPEGVIKTAEIHSNESALS